MKPITLRSPAKLNLSLKVLRKRADGYHDLKTLFERINLCDEITFKATADDTVRIRCSHPHVPCGPKNLIFRTALLLKKKFRVKAGVEVFLEKRIPVAAGLAGGSSNAATALKGLNMLWKLGMPLADMVALAKEVGSDVPFFLHDCSWALGLSRGDEIDKLDLTTKLWHILVVPRIKMYSGEVFANLNLQ
ncbi:MAG: 4-(cytidine 5'-diphospho)-2-C-methyl-D-erythritol kinase, partial [Candidatus Omnitrophota bacterium]